MAHGTGQEMDLEDLTPPKVVQHHIQVQPKTLSYLNLS